MPASLDVYKRQGQTFIVFTPTNDMRALRPAEIGFFRYCSERKQWAVILNNQPPLVLRRGMTAEQDVYKRQEMYSVCISCPSISSLFTGLKVPAPTWSVSSSNSTPLLRNASNTRCF